MMNLKIFANLLKEIRIKISIEQEMFMAEEMDYLKEQQNKQRRSNNKKEDQATKNIVDLLISKQNQIKKQRFKEFSLINPQLVL